MHKNKNESRGVIPIGVETWQTEHLETSGKNRRRIIWTGPLRYLRECIGEMQCGVSGYLSVA